MIRKVGTMDSFVPWGKLRRGEIEAIHPLIDHMIDVAACFDEIAACNGIARALRECAHRQLDPADIARLGVIVFLHDIGKANAGFQSRRWQAPDRPPVDWPTAPHGHGPEGWALVSRSVDGLTRDVLAGLPLAHIASWAHDGTLALLHASISHHGRPLGDEPGKQAAYWIWEPVIAANGEVLYDPADTIVAMGETLQRCYPLAFERCCQPLPDTPAFLHLFAGLVQLADWLGSDTRPGFFDYSLPGEDRMATACKRARHAVEAIGLSVKPWRDALVTRPPTFTGAFKVPAPRQMQLAAADPDLGQIVVLEAETGSGKTEAALWRFVQLFLAGNVDSLFFALPSRAAATQLYDRVRLFVERAWPVNAPVVVRALPGYEAADGSRKISLPDFQVLWADEPSDEVAHRRWAAESPKRFLAATISVGTIDQVLLGALRVRHAHLRHAMLSRSLLVVDEVHASDAYMTVLLEQLLKGHLKAGGQALLLSATLGSAARTRYLNIGRPVRPASVPTLEAASVLPYPAVSYRDGSVIQLQAVEGNPHHKIVQWQTLDAISDPDRVAALAVGAAAQGACVLVVRNTVPAAVETLLAVERFAADRGGDWLFKVAGVSTLHHSRFSRQDRPLLDNAVEAQLGTLRPVGQGRVIIGTQTLEQSLDIDADLLITDLCPMDVLLQRVGRLHRHTKPPEHRPAGYLEARAWILTPPAHDLAPLLKRARYGLGRLRDGGGVYPDLRILEATRRLVDAQPSRSIPAENRALVENATHPEALKALEDMLGADWQKVGQAIEGDTGARRGMAHLHALSFDQPFDSMTFPESDQKIATRLGAADRLIAFDPPQPGPFGQSVNELALRFHQVPAGLAPDVAPSDIKVLASQAGFEFNLGDAHYRYSRLGVEWLRANARDSHSPGTAT